MIMAVSSNCILNAYVIHRNRGIFAFVRCFSWGYCFFHCRALHCMKMQSQHLLSMKQRCRPAQEFARGGLELLRHPTLTPCPMTTKFGHHPPSHMYNWCDVRWGGYGRRAIGGHNFHRIDHDSGVFCVVGEVGLP